MLDFIWEFTLSPRTTADYNKIYLHSSAICSSTERDLLCTYTLKSITSFNVQKRIFFFFGNVFKIKFSFYSTKQFSLDLRGAEKRWKIMWGEGRRIFMWAYRVYSAKKCNKKRHKTFSVASKLYVHVYVSVCMYLHARIIKLFKINKIFIFRRGCVLWLLTP